MENTTYSREINKNPNNYQKSIDINPEHDTVIAVFKNHHEVDEAVRKLLKMGFNTKHFSIVGKGYHSEETAVGFYNTADRVKIWGKYGAFWGAFWGILFGGLFMVIPAFGSIVVLGPLASMVLSAVEGAVVTGGLSALGAALFSIGIPKDSAIRYEEVIKTDGFLLIGYGPKDEIDQARVIINESRPDQIDSFSNNEAQKI